MAEKIMEWKCACGTSFRTKKECEKHIWKVHGEVIRHSAGLATLRYHPRKIKKD